VEEGRRWRMRRDESPRRHSSYHFLSRMIELFRGSA
jgi:hypothetical protein